MLMQLVNSFNSLPNCTAAQLLNLIHFPVLFEKIQEKAKKIQGVQRNPRKSKKRITLLDKFVLTGFMCDLGQIELDQLITLAMLIQLVNSFNSLLNCTAAQLLNLIHFPVLFKQIQENPRKIQGTK